MSTQLRKPVFCKVKELENSRSGYNVYVKVISVQKSQTQSKTPIVRAVVGDETGCANAFFKGENANLIQQGKVIAIRNGTIKFIKNKISLQIDLFGRITAETVDISTNSTNNISDKEIQRKPRRKFNNQRRPQGGDRRPRRQDDQERRPRRQGDNQQRRPRREFDGERPPRREFNGERPPRRQFDGERPPRREFNGERPPRREYDGERPPRREFNGERPPRREFNGERPRRDNDFDRRPRRQGDQQGRPRREDNGDRRPRQGQNRGDRRPPVQFTKIGAIQPADEGINFFAQVVGVEQVGKRARVILGDETGIVKAFLYKVDAIQVGESVVVFKAEARVVKQHIEIQVMDGGKVDVARRKVEQVNQSYNVSAKEWVEADQ